MATNITMMIMEHDSSCGGGGGDESNSGDGCDFGFEFNEDEMEVANILLDLPHLISNSLSFYGFSFAWGRKRRRSALEIPNQPLPPPTMDISATVKTPATSPDTPLVFFPCESDAKSKRQSKRKTPVKRTREELQRMVDERIETQETLLGEIKKVKLHLEKLKAENHELKANKEKLMETWDVSTEKTQLNVGEGSNPVTELIEEERIAVNDGVSAATSTQLHHQLPLIPHHQGFVINQMAHVEPDFRGQFCIQRRGPLGFDLNVSPEEMVVAMESTLQPLDQKFLRGVIISRAMAAQAQARAARQNRIQVYKAKKLARVR